MICPHFKFPKRSTLRRQVKDRFEQLRARVKDQLQNCSSKISFTIDGWTSIACKSFYGITIHFIDHEWIYQSMVLDFIPSHGKHTGRDISYIFHKCLVEFNLENKVQGITVDNASANTKFMTELEKLLPDFDPENQHFRCMAHILNLGVQDLMKNLKLQTDYESEDEMGSENEMEVDQEIDEEMESVNEIEVDQDNDEAISEDYVVQIEDSSTAIMKLRSIFSKIKRSEKMKNKFRSICDTMGVSTTLSPILDCPTRWNSTHDMLGVALKLKKGIITLSSILPELTEFQISKDEWFIFEKVHKFLINFKSLSTRLGGEKYVTLPQVVVSFNLLVDKIETTITQLHENILRTAIDEQLLLSFQAARDKILKHYKKTNWIYCISLILDPRHKAETFDLTPWGTELKESSLRKFEEIYELYFKEEPVSEVPEEEDLIGNDEDIIDFNALYSTPINFTNSQNSKQELEKYLSQPRSASSVDILQWWKLNQLQFPVLAKMARDFLSISATSVPAERLFSKASLVIRKHRNRLSNESAQWLLCINSWSKKLL